MQAFIICKRIYTANGAFHAIDEARCFLSAKNAESAIPEGGKHIIVPIEVVDWRSEMDKSSLLNETV